jgi:hypothetical protein
MLGFLEEGTLSKCVHQKTPPPCEGWGGMAFA